MHRITIDKYTPTEGELRDWDEMARADDAITEGKNDVHGGD